jgi:hypothetical protein
MRLSENAWFFLWGVLIFGFILTAGWFIGSAIAHSNQVEHDRQITCIKEGGHMDYVMSRNSSDLICRK